MRKRRKTHSSVILLGLMGTKSAIQDFSLNISMDGGLNHVFMWIEVRGFHLVDNHNDLLLALIC
jgi:hypothetical protein